MLNRIEIRNFKAIQDEPPIVEAGFNPPKGKESDYDKDHNGNWFKKKPLILKNLAQVNYLVGKNGSGKSSVLDAMWLFSLEQDYTYEVENNEFPQPDSLSPGRYKMNDPKIIEYNKKIDEYTKKQHVNITLNIDRIIQDRYQNTLTKNLEIGVDNKNVLYKDRESSPLFNRCLFIYFDKKSPIEIWSNLEFKNTFLPACTWENMELNSIINDLLYNLKLEEALKNKNTFKFNKDQYLKDKINIFHSYEYRLEHSQLLYITDFTGGGFINKYRSFGKGISEYDTWQKELEDFWKDVLLKKCNRYSSTGGNSLSTLEATGMASLYTICQIFWLLMEKDFENIDFVLIEEPEINLHPTAQKLLPILFGKMSEIGKKYNRDIKFLISTHSPFIIAESGKFSGENKQNVYMIEGGEVVDKNGVKKSEQDFDDDAEKGYSGNEVASVVAKMLGAEGSDLGYPENFCILEEDSLRKILVHCRDTLGIIKNWEFISASGAENVLKFDDMIHQIEIQRILLICNIFYKDQFCVIIDCKNEAQKNNSNYQKLNRLNNGKEKRFKELEKRSLEEYYPEDVKAEFNKESEGKEGALLGEIKSKFALKINQKINSTQDFKTLFNNELNFLLKD